MIIPVDSNGVLDLDVSVPGNPTAEQIVCMVCILLALRVLTKQKHHEIIVIPSKPSSYLYLLTVQFIHCANGAHKW